MQLVLRDDDGTTGHRQFQLSIDGCDPADQCTDYVSIPANTWYHVVFTYDSVAKVARFHGNNQLLKTFSYTTTTSPAFVGGMTLGDLNGTDRQYTGQLDEFRIYDAPISPACVNALYLNSYLQSIKGIVRSGGSPVEGASVSWSLTSGQALSNPTGTVWTDSTGAYSILVPRNSGPYYIVASAPGFVDSSEYSPAPSVTNADVTGIDLALTRSASVATIGDPFPKVTHHAPVSYSVSFDEPVTGFSTNDVTLNKTGTTNGTVGVSGSGDSYTVTISGITGDGTLGISVAQAADPSAVFRVIGQDGSIVDAKKLDDGQDVALADKPLYFKGDGFGYIEEGVAGIRLQGAMTADENGLAALTGFMRKPTGGEQYIELTAISSVSSQDTDALGANQKSVKTSLLDGLKVTIWGKVKAGSLAAHSYVISDGYDAAGVLVKTASTPTVHEGDAVAVTGAAGYDGGRVVYAH